MAVSGRCCVIVRRMLALRTSHSLTRTHARLSDTSVLAPSPQPVPQRQPTKVTTMDAAGVASSQPQTIDEIEAAARQGAGGGSTMTKVRPFHPALVPGAEIHHGDIVAWQYGGTAPPESADARGPHPTFYRQVEFAHSSNDIINWKVSVLRARVLLVFFVFVFVRTLYAFVFIKSMVHSLTPLPPRTRAPARSLKHTLSTRIGRREEDGPAVAPRQEPRLPALEGRYYLVEGHRRTPPCAEPTWVLRDCSIRPQHGLPVRDRGRRRARSVGRWADTDPVWVPCGRRASAPAARSTAAPCGAPAAGTAVAAAAAAAAAMGLARATRRSLALSCAIAPDDAPLNDSACRRLERTRTRASERRRSWD